MRGTRLPRAAQTLLLASAFTIVSTSAHGAGFAIIEQSTKGQGVSFAGGAASASDASTVFFNPAGMTRLKGTQSSVSTSIIAGSIEFDDEGSVDATTAIPLSGSDGNDGGTLAIVPSLYYVRDINDKFKFGLGVNAPFGLATKYSKNWQGRYQGIESRIETININPSIAYKLNDRWSFGAGLNGQYIKVKLTNALDFSAICLGTPQLAANCGAVGLGAGTIQSAGTRGDIDNSGDDFSFGWNAGLLYEFNQNTRIGFHFRSSIRHKLEGDADVRQPGVVANGNNQVAGTLAAVFRDSDISANLELPSTFSTSLYHRMDNWAIMGDFTFTRWNSVDEVRIDFDNPLTPDGVEELGWVDAKRFSIGAEYYYNKNWTFRAGVAYDETPVPDENLRTVRLPDQDRTWVSFGASYVHTDKLSFDVGYTHLFFKDADINRVGSQGDRVVGENDVSADILSAQLNWNF